MLEVRKLALRCSSLIILGFSLISIHAAKGADTNAAQAVLEGNGSGTKEVIWQGQNLRQVINYNFEVSMKLTVQFLDVQGDLIRYTITGYEGHIHFWGTAEEHVDSSMTDGLNFDIVRRYPLPQPADYGVLYYSSTTQQVVYADFTVETMSGIRPYRVEYFGYTHPHSVRVWIDNLGSRWAFDDIYEGCSIPVGADFTNPEILLSCNGTRIAYNSSFVYNTPYGSSWCMVSLDAFVQISFPLDVTPEYATLVLRHLSSANSGCPGGGYSPIDILVNDQIVEQQYDPAENHNGSHGYVTDQWQIGQYLKPGTNTVRLALCDNACTPYWISNLDIYTQQSQLDCATCTLPNQSDLSVDLATDINNDGTIDSYDDEIEDVGLGEIIRIDNDDDPFGEDDLQEVRVTVSPHGLSEGLLWITYDPEKVTVWEDEELTIPIPSIMNPEDATFRLSESVEIPARLFVEGVGLTEEGNGTTLTVHLLASGGFSEDTLLLTVTGEIGHFAYFAGVRDYLIENQYQVFTDEFRAPGLDPVDFRITAVKSDTSKLEVYDAHTAGHTSIHDVLSYALAAVPDTRIILNGTFFDDLPPYTGQTVGRIINNYEELSISTPMKSDGPGGWCITNKSWFGQQGDYTWVLSIPSSDPLKPSEPVSTTPPHESTDLRAAVGGLVAVYPIYHNKTLQKIVSESAIPYGWDHRPSNYIGFDTDQNTLFAVTTTDVFWRQWWRRPIDLAEMISNLGKSGADVTLYGLDGGTSIALAHTDQRGDNLEVKEAAPRHFGFGAAVSNYVIIQEMGN